MGSVPDPDPKEMPQIVTDVPQMQKYVSSNIEGFEESGARVFEGSGIEEFERSSIEEFEVSGTKESKGISNKLKY
ncbi:unnamed protein product [Rhizophagus irregularis]|nr:unnamed protein product [Rhizophagus irregularis]